MKKQTIIALLLLFYYISPIFAQNCTGNLLQNPGFESGLTNWDGNGELVTTGANTGTKAVKICTYGLSARQTITAQAGNTYTLNGFLKKDATANVFVFLKFLNSSFTPLVAPYADWQGQGTTWSAFTPLVWLAPSGTAYIEVSLVQNGGTSCVFADDFCLTTGSAGTSCLKNYAFSQPSDLICGEKTATGYRTVVRDFSNTFVTANYDANRDLVGGLTNSVAPTKFFYRVNGNLEKRDINGTLIDSKPLPAAITNLYGPTGTGCEIPSGGYYLAMKNGINTVVLKTNATFGVLSTKVFAPNPVYVTVQEPTIITPTSDGGYIYGVNIPAFNSNTLTRILKINASNTTQYEFNVTGTATSIVPSPCGTGNRYSINSTGFDGSATINSSYEIDFDVSAQTIKTYNAVISNSFPGGIATINQSVAYYAGYDIQFESSRSTNTSNGQVTKTARALRYDGANPVAAWIKTLPTDTPIETAIVFEKGPQNAVIIGKNWSYDTECGTPVSSAITMTCPADLTFNECFQFAGGPGACTNCHTIVLPTATSTCAQGGVTVTYEGSTILSGTMIVNNPTGTPPNNISVFGLVTRGFGQAEVRFKATDACGNTAMCSYKITNTELSTAITYTTCPTNITVNTATGQTTAIVNYATPTITALCGPTAPTLSFGPASGSAFPIGTTIVRWTAANVGQTQNCEFTVTVNPAGTGGGTCANNLIQNADFSSDLSNWASDGGAVTIVNAGVNNTKAAKICTNGARIYQTKSAVVGKTYTFKASAKNDGTGSPNCLISIKFMNASFTPLNQTFDVLVATSTTFATSTTTLVAPANTAFVEVTLSKNNGAGCVIIDDACLTETGVTNLPDLQIIANTLPATIAAGATVNYSVTVKNAGLGSSGSGFLITPVLSTSNQLPVLPGYLPLGTLSYNTLAAGASSTVNGQFTLPANQAAGNYYIIMSADVLSQVAEDNENNNLLIVPITIGNGSGNLPDLNMANLNITNATLNAGQILNFKFDLKNTGTGNATGNFNIKSYISTDNVLSANDIQDGVVPTGNLIAGANILQTMGAATIPASLAAGSYYLILKVDADNAIAESDENNNELKRTLPFTVTTNQGGGTGADLEVTLTGDKTNVPQWNSVTLTATAKNTGNQTVTNAVVALSLCPGNVAFGQTGGLVYESIPTAPSLGTYNYVDQKWTITNLQPGQSATLTVKLFALTGVQKKISAASLQQSPNDPDSQPSVNDIPNCTPTQDDEAIWTINAGQGLVLASGRAIEDLEKTFIEKISFLEAYSVFPNPASESVFIKTPDNHGVTKITLLNQMGLVEKTQAFSPTLDVNNEPENLLEFPLQEVSNGVYFMKIETAGQRTVVRKLVVSRMY
jgi:hypothetical protein